MTATDPGVTGSDVDRMVDRLFLGTPRQRSAFWTLLVLAAIIAVGRRRRLHRHRHRRHDRRAADDPDPWHRACPRARRPPPVRDERRLSSRALPWCASATCGPDHLDPSWLRPTPRSPAGSRRSSSTCSQPSPPVSSAHSRWSLRRLGHPARRRDRDLARATPGGGRADSRVRFPSESLGALLLFTTNVAAIIATGTALLLGYRVRTAAVDTGRWVGRLRALAPSSSPRCSSWSSRFRWEPGATRRSVRKRSSRRRSRRRNAGRRPDP